MSKRISLLQNKSIWLMFDLLQPFRGKHSIFLKAFWISRKVLLSFHTKINGETSFSIRTGRSDVHQTAQNRLKKYIQLHFQLMQLMILHLTIIYNIKWSKRIHNSLILKLVLLKFFKPKLNHKGNAWLCDVSACCTSRMCFGEQHFVF